MTTTNSTNPRTSYRLTSADAHPVSRPGLALLAARFVVADGASTATVASAVEPLRTSTSLRRTAPRPIAAAARPSASEHRRADPLAGAQAPAGELRRARARPRRHRDRAAAHARSRYDDPYGRIAPASPTTAAAGTRPGSRPGFGFDRADRVVQRVDPGRHVHRGLGPRPYRRPGTRSSWDCLGRWASHDTRFHRMSLGAQRDDLARVAVDTWSPDPATRLSALAAAAVACCRRAGTGKTPSSRWSAPWRRACPASLADQPPRTGRRPLTLAVPRYSQEIHRGEYPQ